MAIKETVLTLDLTREGRHPVVKFRLNDNKVQKITFRLTNNGQEVDLEREMGDQFKPVFECIFRDKTFKRDEDQGNWEIKRDAKGKYPLYTFTYYLTDEVINKSGIACYYFALETPEGLRISTPTLKMVIDCDFKEDGKPSENYVSEFEKLLKEAERVKQTIEDLDQILQEVIAGGESITEVIEARTNANGVYFNKLKDRLADDFKKNNENISKLEGITNERMRDIVVNVKDFGAKGDGITDDTEAFRKANLFGYNMAAAPSGQLVATNSMQIYIPRGVYRLKGTKIMGSPQDGISRKGKYPILFSVVGDNATIIWDLNTPEDELFYFDGNIDEPQVEKLNIFTVSEDNTIPVGGTVFKFYNNLKEKGMANSSKSCFRNVSVFSGRSSSNFNYSTRPKYVFKSIGDAMSDQALVINCRFQYFETFFHSENQESVNWTFKSCGFYGGGWGPNITYFSFTRMGDNFNVDTCSFSVSKDETLLKARSTRDTSNKLTQTSHYNFNFRDNRIEIHGDSIASWKLCDMDFGRLNISNCNLRLAGGSSKVKTIISLYALANINIENVAFNEVEFRLPILTNDSLTGAASSYGALLRNCDFINNKYYFKYYDGVNMYELKDTLLSTMLYRHLKFENCTVINSNGLIDFEIVNCNAGLSHPQKNEKRVSFSTSGSAFGNTYKLPPYQSIKNITLNMSGSLPPSYNRFRIYFGDKSLNNYIDVENPLPSVGLKNNFMLFEGMATIFYQNLNHQSITVYVLNDGVETSGLLSEVTLTYEPLDARLFNITSSEDVIVIKENAKGVNAGATSQRPTFGLFTGKSYYDTSLSKPIWWNGSVWKDALGVNV